MVFKLQELINKIRGQTPTAPRGCETRGFCPEDLVRRTVRAGKVELPILNLAGLWALRQLVADDGDDAANILKVLWVLRHQHTDRILDVVANAPTPAELAALGREIDLASLADYLRALEEMFALLSKKKPLGGDGGATAKASP